MARADDGFHSIGASAEPAATVLDAGAVLRALDRSMGGARVERVGLGGEVVWIKRPASNKSTVWHRMQRFVARLVPLPILRPTVSFGGVAALEQEVARIRDFAARGLRVPRILARSERAVLLSDLGRSIKQLRDDEAGVPRAEVSTAFVAAAAALGRLHALDLVHGRPVLRDMCWDGREIGFVDLEEAPQDVMPLASAKARDVWLLFSQICGYAPDAETPDRAFDAYAPHLTPEVVAELRRVLRVLGRVVTLLGPTIRRFGNRELRRALAGTEFLIRRLAAH